MISGAIYSSDQPIRCPKKRAGILDVSEWVSYGFSKKSLENRLNQPMTSHRNLSPNFEIPSSTKNHVFLMAILNNSWKMGPQPEAANHMKNPCITKSYPQTSNKNHGFKHVQNININFWMLVAPVRSWSTVTYQHLAELSWESNGGATNGLGLLALNTMAAIATRQWFVKLGYPDKPF